jgi:hypothetical protein
MCDDQNEGIGAMEKNVPLTCTLIAAAVAVSGCASSASEVTPAYASPLLYHGYDCDQLGAEAQRLRVRLVDIGGRLDQAATNDKIWVGASVLLFWPAAFWVGGNKGQEAEFARLKGEFEAVQQAAIQRKCSSIVTPAAPQPPPPPASAPLPKSSS